MFEASLSKNMDEATKASIEKSNALFNSKEMVEATLIKELHIYHSPYGGVYYTDEMSFQTSSPNPLGGEPIPTTCTQKITSYNPKQGTYTITFKQKIDSLDVIGMLDGIIRKMNLKSDSSIHLAKRELLDYRTNDYGEYVIKQSSGWVTKLSYTRTFITSGKKEIETFEMELK